MKPKSNVSCIIPEKLIGVRVRQVPGWRDYFVGENGTCWSNKRGDTLIEMRGRPTNPNMGYRQVMLYGYTRKSVLLHRAVWSAFVEDVLYLPKRLVLHRDSDSYNHSLSNLYCPSEDSYAHNNTDTSRQGRRGQTRKLSDQDILDIKRLCSLGRVTRTSIAREYSVSSQFIDNISWGKRYKRFTHWPQSPLPKIPQLSD